MRVRPASGYVVPAEFCTVTLIDPVVIVIVTLVVAPLVTVWLAEVTLLAPSLAVTLYPEAAGTGKV